MSLSLHPAVDNGIASHAGVAHARACGLQVLVTDHHLPAVIDGVVTLPAADVIVNPNQPDCNFESKATAGVGVMFYVLLATRAELRATQASATVIEYLQRPAGTIRVMQDVLDAMRQTVRQPAGPILFLDTAPAGDMSIASQAALAAADAHGIHADLDRDGRLSRLLLGEMVATSPLLPQLVQHLVRRGVDDARLVQALRTPFLQAPA